MDQIESLKVVSDRLCNRTRCDGCFRAVGTFTKLSFAGWLLYRAIAMGEPWLILAAIATSMTVVELEYLTLWQRFDRLFLAVLYDYTFVIDLTVSALETLFQLHDRYGAETARLAGGMDHETKQLAADDLLFF